MWKSPKNSDSAHSHRTTTTTEYTDISNGYITLTFLCGANTAPDPKTPVVPETNQELPWKGFGSDKDGRYSSTANRLIKGVF
jgi:hypothetical protein